MKLELIEGVQGLAVYLNDIRITPRSTKPLGGGKTVKRWKIDKKSVIEAVNRKSTANAS